MGVKNTNILITLTVIICSMLIFPLSVQAATINTYPLPACYTSSTVYSLKVEGVSVPVINYTAEYDYAHFSMSGGAAAIEVTTLPQSSISSYWISPKKLNLTGTTSGNKLTFTISKDEYLIIIINKQKKLVIAADPGETDKPASSGTGIYNVTASPYYADKTGSNYATTPIQNAINDASSYGGGIVYVPAGVYKVGNLQLKSNMKLYLEGGAVLRCSGNPADYTTHFHKDSQNKDGTWWIYTANGANNVKLYGRGTLDGNGYYMRNINNYVNNILMILNSSNFTFDGLIVRDAALWGFIIARSNNCTVKNYKHFNYLTMIEDDCIDVCESQNVIVQNAIGIADDDPFSTKTWDKNTTDICANWYGNPEICDTVTFDDCISWTKCAGYKVGQGTKQTQKGIVFKNSVVYDCSKALAIQHSYGTAEVMDVTFDNIDIECVRGTNFGGPYWLLGIIENGSSLGLGPITSLVFKNIRLREIGTNNSVLRGYDSSHTIKSVSFSNIILPSGAIATSLTDLKLNPSYVDNIEINGSGSSRPNLALNRPVTVSSTESGSGANIVDGNLGTRWASLRTDPQWVYIDLGAVKSINGVKLHWEAAYGKSYQIQTSSDGLSWATKYSTTTGDGGIDEISFPATPYTARYVRLYCTERGTSWGYSLYEFEVYSPNLAENRTTYCSSSAGSFVSSNAVDGNTGTRWGSAYSDPQWIYVDLGSEKYVSNVRLQWEAAYGKSYQIQTSSDASSWVTKYSTTTGDGLTDDITITPTSARYIRMYGTERGTTYGYSLWEFEVY